ncbi:MAG TPA: TIGR00730 family Rossman fold protein, partial [Candidatus Acidoferrum sp.]|nr:TIGR00730 family Rossman fold protein [Candidatus Acidoferrum sp.]
MIRTVCVYCSSSDRTPPVYLEAAAHLGRALAEAGIGIVYGGSSLGSMGRMATAALEAGGKVTGILPRFMDELEWGNRALTELRIVDDMHERKRLMLELSDAVIALPGGCGTLEELFEAIAWKRLGLYFGPVVMVNVNG